MCEYRSQGAPCSKASTCSKRVPPGALGRLPARVQPRTHAPGTAGSAAAARSPQLPRTGRPARRSRAGTSAQGRAGTRSARAFLAWLGLQRQVQAGETQEPHRPHRARQSRTVPASPLTRMCMHALSRPRPRGSRLQETHGGPSQLQPRPALWLTGEGREPLGAAPSPPPRPVPWRDQAQASRRRSRPAAGADAPQGSGPATRGAHGVLPAPPQRFPPAQAWPPLSVPHAPPVPPVGGSDLEGLCPLKLCPFLTLPDASLS